MLSVSFQERSWNGKNKIRIRMLYGVNTSFKSVYLPSAKNNGFYIKYLEKTKYDHTMMMTRYDDDGDASLWRSYHGSTEAFN